MIILFGNLLLIKAGDERDSKAKPRKINYSSRVNYSKNIIDKKRKGSFRQRSCRTV